jgi:hypothetical protein
MVCCDDDDSDDERRDIFVSIPVRIFYSVNSTHTKDDQQKLVGAPARPSSDDFHNSRR